MPEKKSQNPNTNNQDILEQITAQIAGENDELEKKVNDAIKKSLVPLLEKGIQEAVGMIPNISVPAPTPQPTQQQPQTQQQQQQPPKTQQKTMPRFCYPEYIKH